MLSILSCSAVFSLNSPLNPLRIAHSAPEAVNLTFDCPLKMVYSESDLAFLRAIYEDLNLAIVETKRDSCLSNFRMDGERHPGLKTMTLNDQSVQEILWGLGSFFLSYSHGDPKFEKMTWEEGWKWVFQVRSELAAALGIEPVELPPK